MGTFQEMLKSLPKKTRRDQIETLVDDMLEDIKCDVMSNDERGQIEWLIESGWDRPTLMDLLGPNEESPLRKKIRAVLEGPCAARAMDDDDDVEATIDALAKALGDEDGN